jgi:hypothetical protein
VLRRRTRRRRRRPSGCWRRPARRRRRTGRARSSSTVRWFCRSRSRRWTAPTWLSTCTGAGLRRRRQPRLTMWHICPADDADHHQRDCQHDRCHNAQGAKKVGHLRPRAPRRHLDPSPGQLQSAAAPSTDMRSLLGTCLVIQSLRRPGLGGCVLPSRAARSAFGSPVSQLSRIESAVLTPESPGANRSRAGAGTASGQTTR